MGGLLGGPSLTDQSAASWPRASRVSDVYFEGKGKDCIELLMELHLTAMECLLPYGITQCHLPPNTSEHTPPQPQPEAGIRFT